MAPASAHDQPFTVLVTGANSGVGHAICIRLIDEFLSTRPPTPRSSPKAHTLKIIFTVRSPSKAEETLVRLRRHRDQCVRNWVRKGHGSDELAPDSRVSFEAQLVDLMNLISVQKLARTVQETNSRLDAVVCNAGIANLGGLDWLVAIRDVLRRPKHSVTFPIFMKQSRGQLAPRQLPRIEGKERPEEPLLGEVFASNLFGHYVLVHGLSGLLSARGSKETPLQPARVIWISSLEAFAYTLNTQDIQGLQGVASYGSSKRLTDLLALTSEMPSTTRYVNAFLSPSPSLTPSDPSPSSPIIKPKLYVSHPGVCHTAIASLPLILLYAKFLSFWIARWLGSPWHTITPYNGACAPVWLVLAPQNTIEGIEGTYGKGKWGSATDRLGGESVVKTEVEGWGMGGKLRGEEGCETIRREGRWIGAKELTEESREEFEAQGRECWKEMEQLREEWEKILDGYEGL